jgi:hypothetical protein
VALSTDLHRCLPCTADRSATRETSDDKSDKGASRRRVSTCGGWLRIAAKQYYAQTTLEPAIVCQVVAICQTAAVFPHIHIILSRCR